MPGRGFFRPDSAALLSAFAYIPAISLVRIRPCFRP